MKIIGLVNLQLKPSQNTKRKKKSECEIKGETDRER